MSKLTFFDESFSDGLDSACRFIIDDFDGLCTVFGLDKDSKLLLHDNCLDLDFLWMTFRGNLYSELILDFENFLSISFRMSRSMSLLKVVSTRKLLKLSLVLTPFSVLSRFFERFFIFC